MPSERPATAPSGRPAVERLESWKGIAGYLQRDVRTVQRWEKQEGLPVYRHVHGKLSTVYAYGNEIDEWWNNRRPLPRARAWRAAAVIALISAVGWIGYWISTHSTPRRLDLVTQRVWTGPNVDRLGAVSSDGRYLSYVDNDSLAVHDLAGGDERHLALREVPRWPIFSPDSDRLAYASLNRDLIYELRMIALHGTQERVVFSNPAWPYVRPYDWSPDGREILVVLRSSSGAGAIATISVADGAMRVLKTLDWRDPMRTCFSPDGRWVAYDFPQAGDPNSRDLLLLDAAPGANDRERVLVDHPNNDLLLGWAPDGRSILFASDRTGTADAWIIRVDRGQARGPAELVKKDLGMVWPLGITRDGLFVYARQTPMTDVFVVPIDLGSARVLAAPAPATHAPVGSSTSPDWSPDGRYLACLSRRATVVIHSTSTQDEQSLNPKLHALNSIRWQSDGRALIGTGVDPEGREGVYRIDPSTGQVLLLKAAEKFSAHMREAVSRGADTYYRTGDWDIEPGRLLARQPLQSVYRFAISPDGSRIAYSTFDESWEYLRVTGRELLKNARGPALIESIAWSPDGRWICFARDGKLWRIAPDGQTLTELPLQMPGLTELSLSPDGRQLAFTAGQGHGEVWEMQHFLSRE